LRHGLEGTAGMACGSHLVAYLWVATAHCTDAASR